MFHCCIGEEMKRKIVPVAAATTLLTFTLVSAQGAQAGPGGCDTRVNNNHSKLLECVTVEGVARAPGGIAGHR